MFRWSLLLEEGLGSAECPVSGLHNVTSLSLASQTQLCDLRGFNRLELGCSSPEHVQFIRECSGTELSMIMMIMIMMMTSSSESAQEQSCQSGPWSGPLLRVILFKKLS